MSLLVAATFLPCSFLLDQTLRKKKARETEKAETRERAGKNGRKKDRSPNR